MTPVTPRKAIRRTGCYFFFPFFFPFFFAAAFFFLGMAPHLPSRPECGVGSPVIACNFVIGPGTVLSRPRMRPRTLSSRCADDESRVRDPRAHTVTSRIEIPTGAPAGARHGSAHALRIAVGIVLTPLTAAMSITRSVAPEPNDRRPVMSAV